MIAPKYSSPLRRSTAFQDLPSLVDPGRPPNPPSYPFNRPRPEARKALESLPLLRGTSVLPASHGQGLGNSIENWLSQVPDNMANMVHSPKLYQSPGIFHSPSSTPDSSPHTRTSLPRSNRLQMTPRKIVLITVAILGFFILSQTVCMAAPRKVSPCLPVSIHLISLEEEEAVSPTSLFDGPHSIQCQSHPQSGFPTSRSVASSLQRCN